MTSTSKSIRVSVNLLSQMFVYLDSLKVDGDAFLRSLNIDPTTVKTFDAHIPIETYLMIQDGAAEYVGDPYFGLHMGEFAEPGSWSILGYLMMNCKSLGEAFEKSERYSRVVGNFIKAHTVSNADQVKIVFSTPPQNPPMTRHCFDASLASSVRMMRKMTVTDINPLMVSFTCDEPASQAEYERFYQCPVQFGQKENSFTIEKEIVNKPIPLANPSLLDYFEQYAERFIAEMDRKDQYTQSVTKIVLSRLDDESLNINKVAREMAVSVRTLQKRLEEEGVLFSDLYRDIRQKLAQKYLRENYTVEQITYLLGYSEPSVFRKAFKKWSGITPKEYRESAYL